MVDNRLDFQVAGPSLVTLELTDYQCFAAGYTGRNRAAIEAHIRELAEEGVSPPARVPFCFPVLPHLVRSGTSEIAVYGDRTSGEIEPVLIILDGRPRYLGVGSDHTDRELERTSIPISKQLCQKVISAELWPVELVAEEWDRLEIASSQDGEPYQRGLLADLLPLQGLLETIPRERLGARVVLFGGTLPMLGGLRCGRRFEGSLRNPATGAFLSLAYDITVVDPIT
ncbi:MAG: DUF2848 family protein [Candidatus Acidiferrales bacterium]